jgi:hypothetical protein
MKMACHTCASDVLVDDGAAAAGCEARCSVCGEAWVVPPSERAAQPKAQPTDLVIAAEASSMHAAMAIVAPTPPRQRSAQIAPAAKGPSGRTRRVVGAACALGLACVTLAIRDKVVEKIPVSDRVFAAIGLPVNLAGVEFRNVTSQVAEIEGQKVLAVSGEVTSVRRSAATTVPKLQLTVRSQDGRPLYVWTADAPKSKLEPGESVSFRTRLAAPPEGARDVAVSLVEPTRPATAEPRREAKAKTGLKAASGFDERTVK